MLTKIGVDDKSEELMIDFSHGKKRLNDSQFLKFRFL